MKTESIHLQFITPCFCGGAEPERHAEIRAPSIRGQLRWWFRALGGFRSLAAKLGVRQQEAMIFGSTAGDSGQGGRLAVRTLLLDGEAEPVTASTADVGRDKLGTPRAYLLFPLRDRLRWGFWQDLPKFELQLLWRGSALEWPSLQELATDLVALMAVFAHLGALGHRARRGFGALAASDPSRLVALQAALGRFASPSCIVVREIHRGSPSFSRLLTVQNNAIQSENRRRQASGKPQLPTLNYGAFKGGLHVAECLGFWLKAWRFHGKSPHWLNPHAGNPKLLFGLLEDDHDAGRGSYDGPVNRAALGLPIVQKFSSPPQETVNWEWDWSAQKHRAEGRFASPVLLRPHKDAQGGWHALVIFVDTHKWPAGHEVQLVKRGRAKSQAVSLDLYDAMKADAPGFLKVFP